MPSLVILAFFGLALLGMPIAFALGVAALAGTWHGGIDWTMLPQRMMYSVNSFPLMSIPFFMLTSELMPQKMSELVLSINRDPLMFNLLVAALLLVIGMFLESNAAYIMLVRLLHPIALQLGIDPLNFRFLFVLNLVIGMLTPPVGVVLFVVCGITRVTMRDLAVAVLPYIVLPYIVLMYAVLMACMLYPPLVTGLPRAMGY